MLNHQGARRDKARDLRIAELAQQAEDISIDRFRPDSVTVVEVTADERDLDARIERGGIERDQTALRITSHRKTRLRVLSLAGFRGEPIDGRENFLHFVTDDVPPQLERLTVNPFAMRQVREPSERLIAGPRVLPIDQDGDQHLAAVFRQPAGQLRLRSHA